MSTLKDLREENLRGQRRTAAPPPESPPPPAPEADTHLSKSADTQVSTYVSKGASEGVSAGVLTPSSTTAPAAARPAAPPAPVPASSVLAPMDGGTLPEQVRAALQQHRVRQHAAGTRASVDMSPELAHRMKRYLLDHGNGASNRQLVLELLIAHLTAEGY